MKKVFAALIGSALLTATPAFADSPFNGTWKLNPKSSVMDVKPDEFTLKDGSYSCTSCLPSAYTVQADGAFHAVPDRPYWDELAIKAVDPQTVTFQFRKDGKVVGENRRVVSVDGMSTMVTAMNTNNAAGAQVEQKTVQTRVGAPMTGAHLISGAWKTDPASINVTDNALRATFNVDGDTLRMTSPMGETLEAKLGGDYAPIVGDPGKTMTKAALLAPNRLQLTDMQNGKVTQVTTYDASADGKTLNVAWTDPRDGSKGTLVATKE